MYSTTPPVHMIIVYKYTLVSIMSDPIITLSTHKKDKDRGYWCYYLPSMQLTLWLPNQISINQVPINQLTI